MKPKAFTKKMQTAIVIIVLALLSACFQFDFVIQPYSADLNSSFEVEVSVITTDGNGNNYIPYFGILLPDDWTVDDSIGFMFDTVPGVLVYSDSLSLEMDTLDPAPEGYYWWVSKAIESVIYNYGDTYLCNPTIHTGNDPGTFYLDYMAGSNCNDYYGGLGYARSNDHIITVGLPDNLVVTNKNDSGPGSLRHAINNVDFFGTITFDLEEGDTISLENQIIIEKDVNILGPGDFDLAISGNQTVRIFAIGEDRSPHISNLHIGWGSEYQGGGIYCGYMSTPVLNELVINNNTASYGAGIYCYAANPEIQNTIVKNNIASQNGGGFYFTDSNPLLSDVTISNNWSGAGGGIYSDWYSNIMFDSINRCNIYLNYAQSGYDLYSENYIEVIVDTFTVLYPTELQAYPFGNFSFDILNGKIEQVDGDLFVSPEGSNDNSGLTPQEPLKNIWFAYLKILPNTSHAHTIHLLEGTYSPSSNGEVFPLFSLDYINISGVSSGQVILDAEGLSNVFSFSFNSNTIIANITITGGTAYNGGGIYLNNSSILFKNSDITNNEASDRGGGIYISGYSSPSIFENVKIYNNTASSGGGIFLDNNVNPKFKNVSIINNFAETGGGIYNRSLYPEFDTSDRCNIYFNSSSNGNDIYSINPFIVRVDTFTVLIPNEYHTVPIENFIFDIWHGKLEQADADLFVSPDGDNSNSGLSPEEPLKNIHFAFSKIVLGALHPNKIYLMDGTYGPTANEDIFPICMIDYVNIYGLTENGTILDGEGQYRVVEFDHDYNTALSNVTITNGYNLSNSGGGIMCYYSDPVIENLTISENMSVSGGGIFISNSNLTLIDVAITNNTATDDGGGIYCDYNSNLLLSKVTIANNSSNDRGGGIYYNNYTNTVFDSINRCNIYSNMANVGNDLYSVNELNVIVDTFTVMFPKNFHAYPLPDFNFDILHGLIPQSNIDLYVSPNGDNSNSGLSSDDPLKTIEFANTIVDEDSLNLYTINLLSGVYSPSCNGETFPILLGDYVHLKGTWQGYVVLDAQETANVVSVQNVVQTEVSNLIVTNGSNEYGDGGGIYCTNSDLTISDVILSNNYAQDGGGIFCYNASPVIKDVKMINNTANYSGGGIHCSYDTHPKLLNVTIEENQASEGGGMYCSSSDPVLEEVNIENNTAITGGGICIGYSSNPHLKNVFISDNSASTYGGGIYCYSSNPTLEDVKITHNIAEYSGGGFYSGYNSSPLFDSLNRCDIYLNSADEGNDLYSEYSIQVVVDTFTVLYPKSFHAYPLENFSFDIWHCMIPQVNADLYVSPNGDNSNSGLTADDPLKNIQYALNLIAEDSVNLYTIHLLEGVYSPNSNGEAFPIRIPEYVNLEGSAEEDVILNAQSQSRVIEFYNSNQITVSNISVRGGYHNSDGGGIYMVNSSPELMNIAIKNNISGGYGGGFYCKNSSPILIGITISANQADFGGGFCCSSDSKPQMQNSSIMDNEAINSGGGIYNRINSTLLLLNTIVSENFAGTHGGGIYCGNNSDMYADSLWVTNNQAAKQGGGIFNSTSDLYLDNAVVASNISQIKGGGIYSSSSYTKLHNVIINNNFSMKGGGIYNAFKNHAYKNVLIINNTAIDQGGGIYTNGATYDIYNSTITGNYAEIAGGIYCQNTDIELINCILWNEGTDEVYFREIYGASIATVSWSDVQGGEDGISTNDNGTLNWLEGNIESYPLFMGFGEHPYQLDVGSPCIDAGTPDTTGLNLPLWDLIGNYRIWDGDGDGIAFVDMGTYEFGAIAVGETKLPVRSLKFEVRSYPNPFTDQTLITYYLPNSTFVSLSIFDLSGQLVNILANEFQLHGEHKEVFDANGLPEGIYFLRMKTTERSQTKKIIKL
ncbi:MAG: right-handed parallel beta-helix repeat-containing protein [Bacteroidales bacterium]|nr:right-handed parallel beta-helix repeat-containing protein [Bacteroidales bacterium]